jgi:hypothetical protein
MLARSRSFIAPLLCTLLLLAASQAGALQIRITGGTIGYDNGSPPSGGVLTTAISLGDFSDFDLTCSSSTACTIEDFWFGNDAGQHIGNVVPSGFRQLRGQTAGGALIDSTFPYSDGTRDVALTLGAGGLVTSDDQYFESYFNGVPFPGAENTGEDFMFAFSTDGSLFPRGGPSNNIGCTDADVGGNFFDFVAQGGTLPTGAAFSDGFNLGSTGTLVAIGCYFRQENSFESPFVVTLDVEVVVPEPSTSLLMAGGLAGLGWLGRRRRH